MFLKFILNTQNILPTMHDNKPPALWIKFMIQRSKTTENKNIKNYNKSFAFPLNI